MIYVIFGVIVIGSRAKGFEERKRGLLDRLFCNRRCVLQRLFRRGIQSQCWYLKATDIGSQSLTFQRILEVFLRASPVPKREGHFFFLRA